MIAATLKPIGTDADACRYIIDFIYERCRIRLHDGKEALIRARLGKRMRHLGFASLPQFCEYLRTEAPAEELTHVVDALTTNFTHFMREEDHFKFLMETALPSVLRPGEKRFHVWSAACSSGEEPYSIAFHLAERYPAAAGWDWRITASDISTKVLDKAKKGLYQEDRVRTVARDWLPRYFQKGMGQWAGYYRVKRALMERVDFQQINLIEEYDHSHPFSVIFCRNVMIYFDRATQEQLVNKLCRHLVPHGFLLIGHSESLNGLRVPLRCARPSIYQKNS